MSQERLRIAEQLMKEKRYAAARALLRTIDSPEAREWLRDLQVLAPERPARASVAVALVTGVIGLIVGLALGLAIRPALAPPASTPRGTPAPTADVIATDQPITLSSDQLGLNPQAGPFRFERGRYRAKVTTDGNFILTLDTQTGVCGDLIGSGRSLFNVLAGQASQGQSALFSAQGCNATLQFNGAQHPWTLVIERIGS